MSSDIPIAKIQDFMAGQQSKMLSFLKHLVSLESPTTVPTAQRPVLAQIGGFLSEIGFQIELLPGTLSGGQLKAAAPGTAGEPQQLLLGHCDTVWPLGTLSDMPVLLRGNQLSGPGVFDMKAGLTQMLFALKGVYSLGLKPAAAPLVFINSDEEIGSPESGPAIEQLAQQVRRAFVLEPAAGPTGRLKTSRKGVGQFTIELTGKSAHAGLEPEKGASAILALSFLIQKLYALHNPERGITINVGTVEGGVLPNVVAAHSKATVDVRVPSLKDARRVEQAILGMQSGTPGVDLHITGSINRKPVERTPRNRALWRTARALGSKIGLELEEAMVGGGSDGNITSQFTATLDGLGGVGEGAHAAHEFIYVDKLVERATLLALLLLAPLPLATDERDRLAE